VQGGVEVEVKYRKMRVFICMCVVERKSTPTFCCQITDFFSADCEGKVLKYKAKIFAQYPICLKMYLILLFGFLQKIFK
jgi:hypothetical protein